MNEDVEYLTQVGTEVMEAVGRALPGIAAGLAIMLAFVIGAAVVRRTLRHIGAQVDEAKRPLVSLASETSRYALIVVGLITGLGTMGIDVSALIAGLGLTGFALGFALRDALSNLLAGVLIILYQPFRPGDTITVAGNTGRVVSVDFRYTILDCEGETALVPNGAVFSTVVKVASPA